MGGLFSSPKTVKPPPPPPPVAIPEVSGEVKEFARRRAPRGRRETFLVGDLVPEEEKKKKVLG